MIEINTLSENKQKIIQEIQMSNYFLLIYNQVLMEANLKQITNSVFMIRPHLFRSNEMTAQDNYYQTKSIQEQNLKINQQALKQFDSFVQELKKNGVNVIVVQDQGKYDTPDSIFPNNWISFHQNSDYILYPMYAKNRRDERKINIFQQLAKNKINFKQLKDYSKFQEENMYLQGTGSLVIDRKYKIAYAALSQRTNESLVLKFCEDNNYQPCIFKAYQTVGKQRCPIYHTNVMMWIGKDICGICFQSIDDKTERQKVRKSLLNSKKQICQLNQNQISEFAGNAIMLSSKNNEQNLIIMSSRALNSLSQNQIQQLSKNSKIVHSDISTIQKYGGGGARCMIAEIY